MLRPVMAWVAALMLAACSSTGPMPAAGSLADASTVLPEALHGWSARELPGKTPTHYTMAERDGRACVLAQARRSVSLWRRTVGLQAGAGPGELAGVQFDWWITTQEPRSTVADPRRDDAAARLVLGFDGDEARLSLRNRMQFELAQALTGEMPPFATLMYVWDAKAAPETLIISQRSDRIRKIVVGSGRAGSGQWQRLRRDVQADYRRAFGEAPGRLVSMAMMTDADNTAGATEACYGSILLLDAEQRALTGSLQF